MKTRVVHQTRLVLIACLIAFGLPGSSYAQGGSSYSKGLPTWATSVAYSPDGDAVATGHFDERVRLWDAKTGKLLNILTGHTYLVWDVAYSPDGRTLASATGQSYLVRFWDIASYTGGEPTAVAETSWGQIKRHLQDRTGN